MVAHDALDDVVQAQFDWVVIVSVPVAPLGAAVIRDGVIVNVHDALGSLTVNVRPAIVRVALRAIVPVLEPAVYRPFQNRCRSLR